MHYTLTYLCQITDSLECAKAPSSIVPFSLLLFLLLLPGLLLLKSDRQGFLKKLND
jgi:hypothetical protein